MKRVYLKPLHHYCFRYPERSVIIGVGVGIKNRICVKVKFRGKKYNYQFDEIPMCDVLNKNVYRMETFTGKKVVLND